MSDWLDRLSAERKELQARIVKLRRFLGSIAQSGGGVDVDPNQVRLMHIQLSSMDAYYHALTARLELGLVSSPKRSTAPEV